MGARRAGRCARKRTAGEACGILAALNRDPDMGARVRQIFMEPQSGLILGNAKLTQDVAGLLENIERPPEGPLAARRMERVPGPLGD